MIPHRSLDLRTIHFSSKIVADLNNFNKGGSLQFNFVENEFECPTKRGHCDHFAQKFVKNIVHLNIRKSLYEGSYFTCYSRS